MRTHNNLPFKQDYWKIILYLLGLLGYMSAMTRRQESKSFSRKLFALLAVINFLFAVIFSVHAHTGHQNSNFSYNLETADTLTPVTCLKLSGNQGSPIEHSNNLGCILFCSLNSSDVTSLSVIIFGLVVFVFRPLNDFYRNQNLDKLLPAPTAFGWGSTWVAHGPPSA